jgi:hypothetical protein
MTPTTTMIKQKSTSNYQAAEEEQQCNSAADDDGGCQERTRWRSNNCVAAEERISDMATEEQQMPNPCWQTSNLGRMWRRMTAADKRWRRVMKACQQAAATVGG